MRKTILFLACSLLIICAAQVFTLPLDPLIVVTIGGVIIAIGLLTLLFFQWETDREKFRQQIAASLAEAVKQINSEFVKTVSGINNLKSLIESEGTRNQENVQSTQTVLSNMIRVLGAKLQNTSEETSTTIQAEMTKLRDMAEKHEVTVHNQILMLEKNHAEYVTKWSVLKKNDESVQIKLLEITTELGNILDKSEENKQLIESLQGETKNLAQVCDENAVGLNILQDEIDNTDYALSRLQTIVLLPSHTPQDFASAESEWVFDQEGIKKIYEPGRLKRVVDEKSNSETIFNYDNESAQVMTEVYEDGALKYRTKNSLWGNPIQGWEFDNNGDVRIEYKVHSHLS